MGYEKRILLVSQMSNSKTRSRRFRARIGDSSSSASEEEGDLTSETLQLLSGVESAVSDLEGVLESALKTLRMALSHRWELERKEQELLEKEKAAEEEVRRWRKLLKLGGLLAREDKDVRRRTRFVKRGRTIYRI